MAQIPSPPSWKKQLVTVGVTGTNGKTSTTTWIAAALGAVHKPVARTTTVGAFLDDELLADLSKDYDGFIAHMARCLERGGRFAAVEYTSEALALGFAKAWPADVAAFTNLSHDHLDSHGTPEHYLASKAQLFMHVTDGGSIVLNASDPACALLKEIVSPKAGRVVAYAVAARGEPTFPAELTAKSITTSWDGTTVECEGDASLSPAVLRTQGIGSIFVETLLAAQVAATLAGVTPDVAAEAIAKTPAPPGRFEVIARAPYVVVDFAHTPDAIFRTVATARELCPKGEGKLTVVFGAGGNRDKGKRGPMGAAASKADRIILTSDNPRTERAQDIAAAIKRGIVGGAKVEVELDRRRAIAKALANAAPNDAILILGRGHETEQLIGTEKVSFSDVEVARELLRER